MERDVEHVVDEHPGDPGGGGEVGPVLAAPAAQMRPIAAKNAVHVQNSTPTPAYAGLSPNLHDLVVGIVGMRAQGLEEIERVQQEALIERVDKARKGPSLCRSAGICAHQPRAGPNQDALMKWAIGALRAWRGCRFRLRRPSTLGV